jgi:hydrogenase nickel incorporation protein HypB
MFRSADIVVLNKVDLLPHVSFDVDRFLGFTREVNPRARVFQVSATRGTGCPAGMTGSFPRLGDRLRYEHQTED